MPECMSFFLLKCRKFAGFWAHFVAIFGLVLGRLFATVLAVASVSFSK
jgi:hypothetical protein